MHTDRLPEVPLPSRASAPNHKITIAFCLLAYCKLDQGNRIKIVHSFVLLNITLTTYGNSSLFLFRLQPDYPKKVLGF